MSRFKVGDRVRILWSAGWPELAGQQGTIVGHSKPERKLSPLCEWRVAPDCWGTDLAPRLSNKGGKIFAPSSCQLVPLTPPDAKTLTAEEILALPDLREAGCPLPVPLRMTGLVAP